MLRYLAVLAVVLACFPGDVSAVTDQEFQDFQRMLDMEISKLKEENKIQGAEISQLKREKKQLFALVNQLTLKTNEGGIGYDAAIPKDVLQNTTIEERVSFLEVQVANLDEDVDFLFDETVIQDERLFSLEQNTDEIEDDVEILQDTTLELDFRVTQLEENGGSGGNSSISELEARVEVLEGTVIDQEARITSIEGDVEDLEGSSADHETRLTAAEENIQGLQMTDINHDARITALEENGGGGNIQNETIAFHAALTVYDNIAVGSSVSFNEIVLNEGSGYDSTTGVFTVPFGGDGMYYLSTYLVVAHGEYAVFDMQLNDDVICTTFEDHDNNGSGDASQAMCSAVVSLVEGDEVNVVLRQSTDDTPLYASSSFYYSGFNGFRI